MAAVDYFLKLDGIDGESNDSKHKDEIEIQSWSWGETNTVSQIEGGGGGAGKVQFQDFHFTNLISRASPQLFQKCATGEHIKFAILSARKSGGGQQDFLHIKIEDVLVSSYQSGGANTDSLPTDQFSLNFAKIDYDFAGFRSGFDVRGGKIT
jgi:type VI secretion system secreted protein Hcp